MLGESKDIVAHFRVAGRALWQSQLSLSGWFYGEGLVPYPASLAVVNIRQRWSSHATSPLSRPLQCYVRCSSASIMIWNGSQRRPNGAAAVSCVGAKWYGQGSPACRTQTAVSAHDVAASFESERRGPQGARQLASYYSCRRTAPN